MAGNNRAEVNSRGDFSRIGQSLDMSLCIGDPSPRSGWDLNVNQAQAAGVTNGLFYGEPTKFTAQQLAEFAQNGPLSKAFIKDCAFSKIILKEAME